MIMNTGKKQYDVIRDVFHGSVNDVYVCREMQSSEEEYYTVWLLKDRAMAKQLLKELKDTAECFMVRDSLCFLFPYHEERPLERFYTGTLENGECENRQIWLDIVVQCMTSTLPDSLMYLLLTQSQMQLGADGSIRFNYFLDLSKYQEDSKTKSCVEACAGILLSLMRKEKQIPKAAAELLERKLYRGEYQEYMQLYHDVKLISERTGKRDIKGAVKEKLQSRKDKAYKVLQVLCAALFIVAAVLIIFRLAFGDFAVYRIFSKPIEQIGTEILLQ